MKSFFSSEKLYNLVLGVNVLGWGFAGLFFSTDLSLTPVRICISTFNIIVGLLFITRKKVVLTSSFINKPSWLLVLFCNGLLFKLSLPLEGWSSYHVYLFIFGTFISMISVLNLGTNFSIRPSLRSLVTTGMYGLVRHPIYLGETIMVIACLLAGQLIYTIPIFLIFMIFQVLRIREEESLLANDEHYQNYIQQTKWRLFPLIW